MDMKGRLGLQSYVSFLPLICPLSSFSRNMYYQNLTTVFTPACLVVEKKREEAG